MYRIYLKINQNIQNSNKKEGEIDHIFVLDSKHVKPINCTCINHLLVASFVLNSKPNSHQCSHEVQNCMLYLIIVGINLCLLHWTQSQYYSI